VLGPATPTPTPIPITARAVPRHVIAGSSVRLVGAVNAAAGTTVALSASAYPYRRTRTVADTVTGTGGAFAFRLRPDRDTRYQVSAPSLPNDDGDRAMVTVAVAGKVVVKLVPRPLGRARVTIVAFHPRDLHWGGATVRWQFAGGPHARFAATPATRTRRVSPYVAVTRTTVALPAGRYRFRACFHAPGDQALASPGSPQGCTGRGFTGGGSLPAGYPGPGAMARAERALAARTGRTALAVVDTEGRLTGVNVHRTFVTGSVVKAMLLVAYLRRLDARGQRRVDPASQAILYPMIHVSDNDAATACWEIVGNAGLYGVAHAAGMTDFSNSGDWAQAQLSAADQARFFFEMDSLVPHEFVGYARFLLSTIARYESWGIPSVARPLGYRVFFKAGWRPTALGQLVHQIARLEGHGRVFSMAIMTDGDPSMDYGIQTLDDVARALL
jgi:hypothetical protein